jgi:Zn-dependent protease with chaperone function
MAGLPEPEYANPPIQEGGGEKSLLGIFLLMLAALAFLGLLAVAGLHFLFRAVAPAIPFAWEEQAAAPFFKGGQSRLACQAKGEAALQALALRLGKAMGMPPDIRLHVHFSPEETPNAYALPGGNIVVFRGLLEHVDSENALSFVLAHELAHVMHRDPLAALGGKAAAALLFAALAGSDGGALGNLEMGLSQLRFSRRDERRADQAALLALERTYGTASGADAFFDWLLKTQPGRAAEPEWLSDHPSLLLRLGEIRAAASSGKAGGLAPLPPAVKALRECH